MDHRIGICSACGARYKIPATFTPNQARCRACKGVVEIEHMPDRDGARADAGERRSRRDGAKRAENRDAPTTDEARVPPRADAITERAAEPDRARPSAGTSDGEGGRTTSTPIERAIANEFDAAKDVADSLAPDSALANVALAPPRTERAAVDRSVPSPSAATARPIASSTHRRRRSLAAVLILLALVGACVWLWSRTSSVSDAHETARPIDLRDSGDAAHDNARNSSTTDAGGAHISGRGATAAPAADISGAGH